MPHSYLGKQTVSSKSIISFCCWPKPRCFPILGESSILFSFSSVLALFHIFHGKKFHPGLHSPETKGSKQMIYYCHKSFLKIMFRILLLLSSTQAVFQEYNMDKPMVCVCSKLKIQIRNQFWKYLMF